jgi:flagellar biosynthetic protein FlhB
MAEDTAQEDKTEEPTARRMEKAREEGQVLRSQDLTVAVVTAGLLASIYALSTFLGPSIKQILTASFQIAPETLSDSPQLIIRFAAMFVESFIVLSPVLGIAVLLAIGGATILDGFVFSVKAIEPKASKINPISGLARIFGIKALVELVKSLLKFLLVGSFGALYLYFNYEELMRMARGDIYSAISDGVLFLVFGALIVSTALAVIAMIDVPYQRWEFMRKLRMTKQEIKDEFKELEGQPEVRQKIKQKQREMAERRMLQDVPTADVVITNPEHFAVALGYNLDSEEAPKILAKGKGFMAQKIKEVARENKVEVFEAPPLARALYFTTEVGSFIPQALYLAVAQVIAYVFGLRAYRQGSEDVKPNKPKPKVPRELVFDEAGNLETEIKGT